MPGLTYWGKSVSSALHLLHPLFVANMGGFFRFFLNDLAFQIILVPAGHFKHGPVLSGGLRIRCYAPGISARLHNRDGSNIFIAHFPFGAADLTHLPAREA